MEKLFMASSGSSSSVTLAVARIAVGIMFLFFAQYKIMHSDFAHGGYQKWVTNYVDTTAVSFYKPFLKLTLKYPTASGYAVGVAEALIGLSMLLGLWVRRFAIVGALFMFNLVLCTWVLKPDSAMWMYLGNQLGNIPLLMLFVVFYMHNAGETLGLDKAR